MTLAIKEDTGSGRVPSNTPEITQGKAHHTERSTLIPFDTLKYCREVNVPCENTIVQEAKSKSWDSLDRSSLATRLITQDLTLKFYK